MKEFGSGSSAMAEVQFKRNHLAACFHL
jgi:hypothetical protein